jgi:hypothetical protein
MRHGAEWCTGVRNGCETGAPPTFIAGGFRSGLLLSEFAEAGVCLEFSRIALLSSVALGGCRRLSRQQNGSVLEPTDWTGRSRISFRDSSNAR